MQFQGPGGVPAGSLSWLTGTSKWREAIINAFSSTYAFPAMTCYQAVKNKGLYVHFKRDETFTAMLNNLQISPITDYDFTRYVPFVSFLAIKF